MASSKFEQFYEPLFQHDPSCNGHHVPFRKLDVDASLIRTETFGGTKVLRVAPEALRTLAREAMSDVAHFLRPGHLAQLRSILDDPESSANDRFVALELLKNAVISSAGVLPMCQDTGTAIVMGKKGQFVWTDGDDERSLSAGVYDAYTRKNLRYSQTAALTMFEETNTKCNLPAQVEVHSVGGCEYEFLFMAKGGGSANKSLLFQQTKELLNEASLAKFLEEKVRALGTSACPPYHLALVVGGLSAEQALKTAKLASARELDDLPAGGSARGRAFRDLQWEKRLVEIARRSGIGAQFGGKYLLHDARVIRLPRHGASCPVALALSCSADRQIRAKITSEGVFLEELCRDPAQFLPDVPAESLSSSVVEIDLSQPMEAIRSRLSQCPVATRLSLRGPLVVARDIAHAKLAERLDAGRGLPDYMKRHCVYYAGPAKTPEGMAAGSFGPTTAGRMDSYVRRFMLAGGSLVMLAKGNRSKAVTDACKENGGFYLGSIGGAAAALAKNCITKVEVLEYPELGMEAVWKIEVQDFPAFVIVDDKGNDFYAGLSG